MYGKFRIYANKNPIKNGVRIDKNDVIIDQKSSTLSLIKSKKTANAIAISTFLILSIFFKQITPKTKKSVSFRAGV